MRQPLYLNLDEEVVSILAKIKKAGGDDIVLVVPRGAKILSSVTVLRLLEEQSQQLGKKIAIATADERGKAVIKKAGIALVSPTAAHLGQGLAGAGRRIRAMGDIRRPSNLMASGRRTTGGQATSHRISPAAQSKAENLSALIAPQTSEQTIKMPEVVPYRRIKYRYIFVPLITALLVGAVFVFYILPHAEVTVIPRTEPITRDLEIQVEAARGIPDIQNLSIPGKKISEELTEAKTYPSTGTKNVGERASGFVTVYNFSKSSLILKKATTRLEAGGKRYYFLQDVGSIRPTARIGADLEVDPTSLIDPVPIGAVDSGEQFNLPAGARFEIYNEVFGHQPNVLYAINGNPIAGGTSKQVKIVSGGDVETARGDLQKTLADTLREKIKAKLSASSRLAENSYRADVLEENISKPVGAEAEQFEFRQKVRITALTYSQQDARDLIVGRTVRLLPDNKFLPAQQKEDVTAQFVSLDLAGGVGTLKAHFESEVRYQINTDVLSRSLLGKTPAQVKEILLARPEVQDVQVTLSPFWVNTVPRFSSKVLVKVKQ